MPVTPPCKHSSWGASHSNEEPSEGRRLTRYVARG